MPDPHQAPGQSTGAEERDDFRQLIEGKMESDEYVRRLIARVDAAAHEYRPRRFRAAEPHELDGPLPQPMVDYGARHFAVGLIGGFVLGLLTALSTGWWPL
jgi:hypothetical protein